MKNSLRLLLFFLCSIIGLSSNAKTISIINYGIGRAKTDTERFNILFEAHSDAVKQNCDISYVGLRRLSIEIPQGATSIPLPLITDFANVEITVRNNYKDFYLFARENEGKEITVSKKRIDKGRFRKYKPLKKGRCLLVVEDQNPWVKVRKGRNYGATRKEVLLVENGIAINSPIQPYNNTYSNPKCYYCIVGDDSLQVSNVTIRRTADSGERTFCFYLNNLNNTTLRNIKIITPSSDLTGDRAIVVNNSTNVLFDDVIIEGTYSKPVKFGYGIAMNNVWGARFVHLYADGNWGVFGTSNVSYFRIENSTINRFDIHCYGKDIYCENTTFKNLYNQFASLYGVLSFDNCRFDRFVPVLLGASYYAYSFFDIQVRNCVISVDKERPYFIRVGIPSPPEEIRTELQSLSLPNITIENTEVIMPNGVDTWSIFNMGALPMPDLDGIEKIILNNVHLSGISNDYKVVLSNRKFNTKKQLLSSVKNSNIVSIEKI